ncbi:hypothetical protein GCM10023169_35730 [Georgenia halophila]|uniref:Cytochrome c oxidase assembly protein n=1 Tax=Georgenia halophila TaxID=620889 RepID=A0ABP8LM08_9MICO
MAVALAVGLVWAALAGEIGGTGHHADLGPPTLQRVLGTVRLDPFVGPVSVLALVGYLTAVRVLRRRGDAWSGWRTAAWCSGVAVALLVTCTGVGAYAMALFSVHMVQHMTLNMVVPALLVLGGPVTLALRALPVGGRRTLLRVLHSPSARFYTRPAVAAGIFTVSVYVLYLSPLFGFLMSSAWGHMLMEAHFLASGLMFFFLMVGVDPAPRRPSELARIPVLVVVMILHGLFSAVLVFSTTVIGAGYLQSVDRDWGPSLLADQHLGGAIAWVVGELPVVALVIVLLMRWFAAADRADRVAERRRGREVG